MYAPALMPHPTLSHESTASDCNNLTWLAVNNYFGGHVTNYFTNLAIFISTW